MLFKYLSILISGILIVMGINSCSLVGDLPDEVVLIDMRLNHFKQTAIGEYPTLVYLSQESESIGSEEWRYFYDEIENFDYEPGFIYDLKIKKQVLEDPPQDGSSVKYILQNVVSKTEAEPGVSFDIRLKWGGHNYVSGENHLEPSLLNEFSINCTDMCDDLKVILESNDEVTGTFIHGSEGRLQLIALQ